MYRMTGLSDAHKEVIARKFNSEGKRIPDGRKVRLHHRYRLSEAEIGKSKKREEKKAKKKSDKKSKPKKRKVAKVALAPARAAFLAVLDLNLLKTATKLARVWKQDGGKEKLNKFWSNFGGKPEKLQKAISKGSKETISGDQMGVVGATALATASPIIIAVVKIIKEFKAGGDSKETKDFDSGVSNAVKDLKDDPDIEKKDQDMPEGADVALVKKKGGADDKETPMGMTTNPITISFSILLILMALRLQLPILQLIASPFALYAMIGFIVIPFSEFGIAGERIKKISRNYFDVPAKYFNSLLNFFSHEKV